MTLRKFKKNWPNNEQKSLKSDFWFWFFIAILLLTIDQTSISMMIKILQKYFYES